MLADKPTELSRIKQKTWTRQPVPMISEHSAHLTPLSVDLYTWIWRYTYLLLLISMLWHRQAIFISKGDKLCSSAECRIWTWGPRHQIASRLNFNSTALPYDQRAFSPFDPTVRWLSHLALAIYIFVVVNFDALAQASDIQIERRQVVFLCRMQDLNPGSQTPNRQKTECLLTNILSYRGSSKNFELDSPSLWSASIQPTWPHCQLTFAPGSGNIHICCCLFRCPGTGKRYLNRKETSCVPLQNTGFEPGVPDTKSPADWMLADKTTDLPRIKQKTWTRQPVPMISKHSAHLTPQPFGIGTWLWRYTCLLLLISMLWHRQAIFNSKGDKLCSSAECRIWTWGPRHQIASRLNACWQTDWAIEDQAKNINSTARPYDQRAFSPLDPTVSWLSHLSLAIYIFVVVNFDALAQASDIQIERRQVVFLCRMQDLNPGSQTPNRQQSECLLTNRLSYRESRKKLELDSPSLWSASVQPTWPHCQLTFAPGSGDIHICCC